MGNTSAELLLPDDKDKLESIRLKEEIQKLHEERKSVVSERRFRPGTALVVVLTAVSPLLIGLLTYGHEITKYRETFQRETQFKITKDVMEVLRDLNSPKSETAKIASLALAQFGADALPFLTESLAIAHPEDVYESIVSSIRLVLNSKVPPSNVDQYACYARDEITRLANQNIEALAKQEPFDPLQLSAQVKALVMLKQELLHPPDGYDESVAKTLEALRVKLQSLSTTTRLPEAKELLKQVSAALSL